MTPLNPPKVPVIGSSVMVSAYNGHHEIYTRDAFVLAIGHLDLAGMSESGHPSITVAFIKDPVDPVKLGSARFWEALQREASVPHVSHLSVEKGTASICWGFADQEVVKITKPKNSADNPIFQRSQLDEPENNAVNARVATVNAAGKGLASSQTAPVLASGADSRAPEPAQGMTGAQQSLHDAVARYNAALATVKDQPTPETEG